MAIGKLEAGFDPLSGELADAMGLPYAFSLIGYSGGAAAGIGNTETGRWDNSAKYTYHWAYG